MMSGSRSAVSVTFCTTSRISAIASGSALPPTSCERSLGACATSSPSCGCTTWKPSSRKSSRFRWIAGAEYIAAFIDGATITGARVEIASAATSSEQSPLAMRAIVVAVAGAITTGAVDPRYSDDRKSSAIPLANFPMTLAVAGATSSRSMVEASEMCSISAFAPGFH